MEAAKQTIHFTINNVHVDLQEDDCEVAYLLQTDDNFTVEFFNKAFQEGRLEQFGITYDNPNLEIIRISNDAVDTSAENYSQEIEAEENDRSLPLESQKISSWTSGATRLLLALYKENISSVGKSYKLKSKKMLWIYIDKEMQKKGYSFTPLQIENRYKTLERGYKETTSNNKKTGRSRACCEFERELTDINVNKRSIFPEFLLDASSSGVSCAQMKEKVGIVSSLCSDITCTPRSARKTDIFSSDKTIDVSKETEGHCSIAENSSTPVIKRPKHRTILEELQNIRKIREKELSLQYEKFTERQAYRKKMIDLEIAKLEAYKTKNTILEKLCNK